MHTPVQKLFHSSLPCKAEEDTWAYDLAPHKKKNKQQM